MKLVLPIPPSPNGWKRTHPVALQVQKDEYREAAWVRAISQVKPTRDPPELVTIRATFYTARCTRDEDNLTASMKWVIDALKQRQTGHVRWRQGIADLCGYLVDDDPAHLTLDKPVQVRVKTKREERLEVEIIEVVERAA